MLCLCKQLKLLTDCAVVVRSTIQHLAAARGTWTVVLQTFDSFPFVNVIEPYETLVSIKPSVQYDNGQEEMYKNTKKRKQRDFTRDQCVFLRTR